MVAYTGVYELPYQTGKDDPKESLIVWREHVSKVIAELTTLNDDINQTARVVPMAKIAATIPQIAYTDNTSLYFDSVIVDTDNWVDLDRSPYGIIPKHEGLYYISGYVEYSRTDTNYFSYLYIMSAGRSLLATDQRWVKSAGLNYNQVQGTHHFLPNNTEMYVLDVSNTGLSAVDTVVNYAELFVVWMGDF